MSRYPQRGEGHWRFAQSRRILLPRTVTASDLAGACCLNERACRENAVLKWHLSFPSGYLDGSRLACLLELESFQISLPIL